MSSFNSQKPSTTEVDLTAPDSLNNSANGSFSNKHDNSYFKKRHTYMIALTAGIGTGLWIGTGRSLVVAGPMGLLLAFATISILVYFVIDSTCELSVIYGSTNFGAPVIKSLQKSASKNEDSTTNNDQPITAESGSIKNPNNNDKQNTNEKPNNFGYGVGFHDFPVRFVDSSLGFAASWNYAIQWLTVLSLELVTATMVVKYWMPNNTQFMVIPFYFLIVFLNNIKIINFGEVEFACSLIKVSAVLCFVLLGIAMCLGCIPSRNSIPLQTWNTSELFNNGFKGYCNVLLIATFAFGGTEFVGLTAANTGNSEDRPEVIISKCIKFVVLRIFLIFLSSIIIIGFLIKPDSPELVNTEGGSVSASSPFVIALSHLPVLPDIMNTVILVSVLSVANSAVFSSSQTLQSLASQGFAPSIFGKTTGDAKRPKYGILLALICGLFSMIAFYPRQDIVFSWLLSISGLSTVFTWMSICLSQIRFRQAMKYHGISTTQLKYKTTTGIFGSYVALIAFSGILILQFWIALWPIEKEGKIDMLHFLQNYLGVLVMILFYLGHKIYTKNWKLMINVKDINLWRNSHEYRYNEEEEEIDPFKIKNKFHFNSSDEHDAEETRQEKNDSKE